MWKNVKAVIVILIFSIALNAAFGAMWAIRRVPAHLGCAGHKAKSNNSSCISCPLHRKLDTSEKQWQEIEPRLMEFKTSAKKICRKTKQMRNELIDLIAAPQTDFEAIHAKQDEILAEQSRMQELLISHLLAEKQTLTPQQQRILFNMIRKQCGCTGESALLSGKPTDIPQVLPGHTGNSNNGERR